MSNFQFMQKLLGRIAQQGRRLVAPTKTENAGGRDIEQLCEGLLSERGEASGVALAYETLDAYRTLDRGKRQEFFEMLATRFGPNHDEIEKTIECYRAEPSNANAIRLHESAEPRRQELIRRLNRAPRGTEKLVSMREDLLPLLRTRSELSEVDHDFDHLLSSWFNPGFLVLERIDWGSPAAVLEKIIRYEAVHEIQSWDDLRRRTEPSDRRCYAFFHPTLIDEPLIFVEVALTGAIPGAIQPILSQDRSPIDECVASTAVFYSISNCQKGLRGISFGNFLIKRVVEELKRDLPQLQTFVTLSPVPGFRRWLADFSDNDADPAAREIRPLLAKLNEDDWSDDHEFAVRLKERLMPLAADYFLNAKRTDGTPVDPVARFHLGNGARLERINWLGDLSKRGLQQAAGLMVNYLYDLKHIDDNHERFVNERAVVASDEVNRMLKGAHSLTAMPNK